MLGNPSHRVACLLALGVVAGLGGCGGSDGGDGQSASDNAEATEERIVRERAEAAAIARQEEKLKALRDEVRRLRKARAAPASGGQPAASRPAPTAPAAAATPTAAAAETFHAPSGNVSCRVTATGATCSVAAIATTFTFDGGAARMESGMAVARNSGYELGWGRSISVGSVTCAVPRADEARGVTCYDSASGHGFEASRVPSRQRTS